MFFTLLIKILPAYYLAYLLDQSVNNFAQKKLAFKPFVFLHFWNGRWIELEACMPHFGI